MAALLLLGPFAAMLIAYGAYTSERSKHSSLEFLLDASRALSGTGDSARGLAGMLAMTVDSYRAETSEACLFATGDCAPTRTSVGPGDALELMSPMARDVADHLYRLIEERHDGSQRR